MDKEKEQVQLPKEFVEQQGSLQRLKREDPEKLQIIRDEALNARRAKRDKMLSFKDLLKGELEMLVVLRDKHTGQIKTDKKGNPIMITKKELMVANTVDSMIQEPNIKSLREIAEVIGEIEQKVDNNINVIFESIRNELSIGDDSEKDF